MFIIDRDGKGLQQLLDNNHFLDSTTRLSWSPDGQFLVYNSSVPDNRINVIDTPPARSVRFIDISAVYGTGNIPGPPAWQP